LTPRAAAAFGLPPDAWIQLPMRRLGQQVCSSSAKKTNQNSDM
jgi:hypothetical protein